MASISISTDIQLPPGPLPAAVVRKIIHLAFDEYHWFQPYWTKPWDEDDGEEPDFTDYSVLFTRYEEVQRITITDRADENFLMVSPSRKGGNYPFVSRLVWGVTLTEEMSQGWRAAHLHQMVEIMRLVGSPLAWAGMSEDLSRKHDRFIPNPDGIGTEQTFTLRDPSEGLIGLYWRNIFGPPFTRMFGERLLSLPPDTCQELGDGLVLVQPYELPTQAMTPEGDAAEARLINVLGPECFYDHQQHRKPTRLPAL
jgi:hypothetical protein